MIRSRDVAVGLMALMMAGLALAAPAKDVRWSGERAKAWGNAQPWHCGVNYIPANAINYTAMWDKTSFSPEVMRKELRLATEIGMNCVRVIIQYKVFEDDPAYLLKVFDQFLANSDIVTFHCYQNRQATLKMIEDLSRHGRPVICTEWMNRLTDCHLEDVLPVYAEKNVGCMLWGLVNGKTQTHLPWGHRPSMLPYKGEWQVDLFRGDFTPYRAREIETLKKTIMAKARPVERLESAKRMAP